MVYARRGGKRAGRGGGGARHCATVDGVDVGSWDMWWIWYRRVGTVCRVLPFMIIQITSVGWVERVKCLQRQNSDVVDTQRVRHGSRRLPPSTRKWPYIAIRNDSRVDLRVNNIHINYTSTRKRHHPPSPAHGKGQPAASEPEGARQRRDWIACPVSDAMAPGRPRPRRARLLRAQIRRLLAGAVASGVPVRPAQTPEVPSPLLVGLEHQVNGGAPRRADEKAATVFPVYSPR
ncbi:uncharacterized protein IWZ02DRAFT_179705 [Phyllosticta citriasiana]|uniref:uncharacterized protein n=1 Tax=Phyllosticta citriasiana TaxID=595635 RepID=UPI0030FD5420